MLVELYTKDDCPYCQMAKVALKNAGHGFSEQKLNRDFSREQILARFPSAKTFPIIVVDGFFIGGYNNLREHLNQRGNSSQILLNE
jgi:glutaredoxin 3